MAACNNGSQSNKGTEKDSKEKSTGKNDGTPDLAGCYLRVMDRDTVALSIQQSGRSVTGKLSFDNFEKDGSTGRVDGTIDGDTLKLIYNFQSEGMHSVMEVYCKIVDRGLITGVGEVSVKSDTAYYSNPGQLEYPESNKLGKLDCEKLAAKYK